jgi:hypothetical protein
MSDLTPTINPLPDAALAAVPATGQPDMAASGCPTCGQEWFAGAPALPYAALPSRALVYAIGRLEARFVSRGAEREFAQVSGEDPSAVLRTRDLKEVLEDPDNRYLARQLCWVFQGPFADSCVVAPRDSSDLDLLIATLAPSGDRPLVQVLVGSQTLGFVDPACARLRLLVVDVEQLLSFTMDEFLAELPPPEGEENRDAFRETARRLFAHLTQRAGNTGVSDEHRALNYLALRYPAVYHLTFTAQREGKALIGVDAGVTSMGERRMARLRLAFRDARSHVVERYLCEVDVTDVLPFVARSLTPTFD